jgi:hypothetical protein
MRRVAYPSPQSVIADYHNVVMFFPPIWSLELATYTIHIIKEISC